MNINELSNLEKQYVLGLVKDSKYEYKYPTLDYSDDSRNLNVYFSSEEQMRYVFIHDEFIMAQENLTCICYSPEEIVKKYKGE